MLVSHETPIAYLSASRSYNDYDYCLVHLCDEYPEYLEFFKESLSGGREVLLDNSIFELGKAFDWNRFADRVEEIKPTFYVVPDVLQDAEDTMASFTSFTSTYRDLPGLKIGVVQGKTMNEIIKCYKFMVEHADYIAISFDCSLYEILGNGVNKLEQWMTGRYHLIRHLIGLGVWNFDKPHHLLGCSLAREFKLYRGIDGIRSLDTSNPVTAALAGEKYLINIGLLNTKPSVKLADQIDVLYDYDTEQLIMSNCREFKQIMNSI
jgi:hypothetical protein